MPENGRCHLSCFSRPDRIGCTGSARTFASQSEGRRCEGNDTCATRRQVFNPTKQFQFDLTGNDLYLFADGAYIYDEWSDVEPTAIRDKGTWNVADGIVNLKSYSEMTWDPDVERKHIAIHRLSRPNEILLVGTVRDLSYFDENSNDDPETELMIICKERLRTITSKQTVKIKEQLMRESWRPEYFRKASR
jgi:hypothetical protein